MPKMNSTILNWVQIIEFMTSSSKFFKKLNRLLLFRQNPCGGCVVGLSCSSIGIIERMVAAFQNQIFRSNLWACHEWRNRDREKKLCTWVETRREGCILEAWSFHIFDAHVVKCYIDGIDTAMATNPHQLQSYLGKKNIYNFSNRVWEIKTFFGGYVKFEAQSAQSMLARLRGNINSE